MDQDSCGLTSTEECFEDSKSDFIFTGFFAVLHCWLNAWAEMLTFGDRLFYKDWWNSTNFSGYYRMWNIVVHDWLFSYVYQDVYMVRKVVDLQSALIKLSRHLPKAILN